MFELLSSPKIQVKRLHLSAQLPAKGTILASGLDIRACLDAPITLRYGEPAQLVPTGLAIWMEPCSTQMTALILPRSGMGHKQGLVLGNTTGVIDADYQGQWFISAWHRGNNKDSEGNYLDITIHPGDRIAQVLFIPVIYPEFEVVEEFTLASDRGAGGFNSTGQQ